MYFYFLQGIHLTTSAQLKIQCRGEERKDTQKLKVLKLIQGQISKNKQPFFDAGIWWTLEKVSQFH